MLIHETKPNYTGEAMRARIQGLVKLEAVVMPDGSVGDVRVVHSLDQQFGLDKEAIKTLRQWRFKPGMRLGQPVPVLILVEISFTFDRSLFTLRWGPPPPRDSQPQRLARSWLHFLQRRPSARNVSTLSAHWFDPIVRQKAGRNISGRPSNREPRIANVI